jgi:hypothetical protein
MFLQSLKITSRLHSFNGVAFSFVRCRLISVFPVLSTVVHHAHNCRCPLLNCPQSEISMSLADSAGQNIVDSILVRSASVEYIQL